jgi:hypothetical protein
MKFFGFLKLTFVIGILLATGGCTTGKFRYQEPQSGDVGVVFLVNKSSGSGYVSNVVFSPDGTMNAKDSRAINAYESIPRKSVKILHQEKIFLSMQLVRSQISGKMAESEKCGTAVEIPFLVGDIQVTMEAIETKCFFKFEQRENSGAWLEIKGVSKWNNPLAKQ